MTLEGSPLLSLEDLSTAHSFWSSKMSSVGASFGASETKKDFTVPSARNIWSWNTTVTYDHCRTLPAFATRYVVLLPRGGRRAAVDDGKACVRICERGPLLRDHAVVLGGGAHPSRGSEDLSARMCRAAVLSRSCGWSGSSRKHVVTWSASS